MKQKIVIVSGYFNPIHKGHLEYFIHAKSKGDLLFVGIDTDKRVKELKGETRPVNSQEDRKKVLEAIRYVDKVFLFGSTDEMECILAETGVDVIVIGDEYIGKSVTGEKICEVDFFKKIPGKSTTSIIERI